MKDALSGTFPRLLYISFLEHALRMSTQNLRFEALLYHQRLPIRIWCYLRARGISDDLIHRHLLGWNGFRITIPIPNRDGKIAFFKLREDPEHPTGPKMLATPGSSAELYGWDTLKTKPERLVICEGEFDRLVLLAQGFPAVTATAGAFSFRPEWAEELKAIPDVFICFDRDHAGRQGAVRVTRFIPRARIVELPEEVGEKGDVTDLFVRLGRTRDDFEALLGAARSLPVKELLPRPAGETGRTSIEEVVRRYTALRGAGRNLAGRCPFHDDRHPSMVVFRERGTFRCYACGAKGDALSFLCRIHRLTLGGLVDRLKELRP